MATASNSNNARRALSLLELVSALTILGVIAMVAIPRFTNSAHKADVETCRLHSQLVEVQCALWNRRFGAFPKSDLSDIAGDDQFFPEGIPRCPIDSNGYQIESSTGRVIGHRHE